MNEVDLKKLVLGVLEESYNFNLFSSDHRNTIADTIVARSSGDESARPTRNIQLQDDAEYTSISDIDTLDTVKIGITAKDLGLDISGSPLEPMSKDPGSSTKIEKNVDKVEVVIKPNQSNKEFNAPVIESKVMAGVGMDNKMQGRNEEDNSLLDSKKKKVLRGHDKNPSKGRPINNPKNKRRGK